MNDATLPPIPEFDGHALTPRQRAFATAFPILASIVLQQMGAPPALATLVRDRLLAPLHTAQPPMDAAMQATSQAYVEDVLRWYDDCAALAPKIVPASKPKLVVVP